MKNGLAWGILRLWCDCSNIDIRSITCTRTDSCCMIRTRGEARRDSGHGI
jgi:hypothetical protein